MYADTYWHAGYTCATLTSKINNFPNIDLVNDDVCHVYDIRRDVSDNIWQDPMRYGIYTYVTKVNR